MTWHLKDAALEEALMKIDSGFVTLLNNKYEFMKKQYGEDFSGFRVEFGKRVEPDIFQCSILVRTSEIEDVQSYNPNAWNKSSKVKPPYDVMMRIELDDGLGFSGFYHHFEEGDYWCYADGCAMPKAYSLSVKRFRPWED